MELLIFILACYGLTSIIARSSIFEPFRDFIKIVADKLKNTNEFDMEDLLDEKYKKLFVKEHDDFKTMMYAFEKNSDIPEVIKGLDHYRTAYISKIKNYKYSRITHCLYWILYKIHYMLNCHQCAGAWVGAAMSFVFVIPQLQMYPFLFSLFIMAFISSGACFVINHIVERLEKNGN